MRRALLAWTMATSACSLNSEGLGDDFVLRDSGDPWDDTASAIDGAQPDVAIADSGGVDSTLADSGDLDTGALDGGLDVLDTGVVDSGSVDSGVLDTGVLDTGVLDTGVLDTGIAIDASETGLTASLTGSGTALGSGTHRINLTNEGQIDWAHWGTATSATAWDRKSGGTALVKGAIGSPSPYGLYPTMFSWTGGTPTATSTDNRSGIYHNGKGESFNFEAAGDAASERTLRVYVAWTAATGTIEASLSDAPLTWSSPIPPAGTSAGSGIEPAVYEIKYRPAASGGKVLIRVVKTSDAAILTNYLSILAATVR
jgi:hypothetical protein